MNINVLNKTGNLSIKVGSSYIFSSMPVRSPGVILDKTLGMENQVYSICKYCCYKILNIGLIYKYIKDETCKTLIPILIKFLKWPIPI